MGFINQLISELITEQQQLRVQFYTEIENPNKNNKHLKVSLLLFTLN